jgi:hypothetical protein
MSNFKKSRKFLLSIADVFQARVTDQLDRLEPFEVAAALPVGAVRPVHSAQLLSSDKGHLGFLGRIAHSIVHQRRG